MIGLWMNVKDRSFIPKKVIFQELPDNLDTPERQRNHLTYVVRESMEAKAKLFSLEFLQCWKLSLMAHCKIYFL